MLADDLAIWADQHRHVDHVIGPVLFFGIATERNVATVALRALANGFRFRSRQLVGNLIEFLASPRLESLYGELVHADEIDLRSPAAFAVPFLGGVLGEIDQAQYTLQIALVGSRLIAQIDGVELGLDGSDVDEVLLQRHFLVGATLRDGDRSVARGFGRGRWSWIVCLRCGGGDAGGGDAGQQGATVDLGGGFLAHGFVDPLGPK